MVQRIFQKRILAICHNPDLLDILEIQYISMYKEIGKAEYNHAPGGNGGDYWQYLTQDRIIQTKQKIREKRKLQAPMTKESRQKLKQSIMEFWDSTEGQIKRQEISEKLKGTHTTKGKHWYNNGIKNVQTFECPLGFVPGRLGDFTQSEETKQKKRDWYKNLTEEQRKEYKQHVSESHIGKHLSETRKQNISKANKGRKYYNNGVIEVMCFECPEGFVPGRCPAAIQKIKQGMNK